MSGTKICIMTPTYLRDIGQFALLRRSIQLFAAGFPHIAIVNTEDYPVFQERFGREPDLKIVKASEVLPREIESRRRKSGPKWLTGRLFNRHPVKGWHAQQLMKLFALATCEYEAAAFVDSDVFFARPLGTRYFNVGEKVKLFRRRAVNAEALDFDISTHDILGNPLHQITQLYDYIYSPSCFRKSSAVRLFQEFERRKRSTWVRRFIAQARPSEYNLLGYAATVLEGGAGYHLMECDPEDLLHSIRFPEDCAKLAEETAHMRRHPKDFVLIQSRLKVELKQIEHAFECVTEAYRGSPLAASA